MALKTDLYKLSLLAHSSVARATGTLVVLAVLWIMIDWAVMLP